MNGRQDQELFKMVQSDSTPPTLWEMAAKTLRRRGYRVSWVPGLPASEGVVVDNRR